MKQYDFSELFASLKSGKQFNKLDLKSVDKYFCIQNIGLHNIKNIKITKEPQLHSHSYTELHYSLEGYVVYQFSNDHILKLEAGEWVLIPHNYPHKIIEYSDQYIKFSCSFYISDQVTNDASTPNPNQIITEILSSNELCHAPITDFTETLIRQLYDQLFSNHIFKKNIIENLTQSIILDTLSNLSAQTQDIEYTDMDVNERFNIAVQFINDNIDRKISRQDVANKVYLSSRQLDRIFNKIVSVSVAEFILEKKCEKAKELLTTTSLSINTISDQLGFSDISYFNRYFKKRTNKPPNKFRKSAKKE